MRLQTCNSWLYTPSLVKVKLTANPERCFSERSCTSQSVRRAVYHLATQKAKLSPSEQQHENLWVQQGEGAARALPLCKQKQGALPGSPSPLARLYQQLRERRGSPHLPITIPVQCGNKSKHGREFIIFRSWRREQKQLQAGGGHPHEQWDEILALPPPLNSNLSCHIMGVPQADSQPPRALCWALLKWCLPLLPSWPTLLNSSQFLPQPSTSRDHRHAAPDGLLSCTAAVCVSKSQQWLIKSNRISKAHSWAKSWLKLSPPHAVSKTSLLMCLPPHSMIKTEKKAQQTNWVTHEQRGKYDFFLPNKKKGKIIKQQYKHCFHIMPWNEPTPTYMWPRKTWLVCPQFAPYASNTNKTKLNLWKKKNFLEQIQVNTQTAYSRQAYREDQWWSI